jgi:hypothetical protein
MQNGQQLAEMEHDMLEEHHRDLEAMERLKRFLPHDDRAPARSPVSGLQAEHTGEEPADIPSDLTEFMYQREV